MKLQSAAKKPGWHSHAPPTQLPCPLQSEFDAQRSVRKGRRTSAETPSSPGQPSSESVSGDIVHACATSQLPRSTQSSPPVTRMPTNSWLRPSNMPLPLLPAKLSTLEM